MYHSLPTPVQLARVDKPWVTNRIKDLILARQKAYKTKKHRCNKVLGKKAELPTYLPSRPLQAIVSEYDVYQHLRRIAKSKSPGPDDIPPRLLREFAPDLATPLNDIFNCSITEGVVPDLWKHHRKFGNIKGSSTVHYLVDLINYITSNVDKRLEVTTVTIDLRKAFDLIDYTTLIKKMISLGFHEGWVK
ncbi:uncharacterized protein [Penaeus vannamei]|uniref:uncharacterized protein n=1 Tax=Penaeus vannamei TaxID=6689 RepID=UPI00387F40AE